MRASGGSGFVVVATAEVPDRVAGRVRLRVEEDREVPLTGRELSPVVVGPKFLGRVDGSPVVPSDGLPGVGRELSSEARAEFKMPELAGPAGRPLERVGAERIGTEGRVVDRPGKPRLLLPRVED